jgi:nitrogen fixation protein FixH
MLNRECQMSKQPTTQINSVMKFNWGTGIVIFYIFFAASMIAAVVATTRHPPQLVQKDYYALDLNYQAHLEKKQNAAALPAPPQVHFSDDQQVLRVKFPEGMTVAQGTAKCYRSATTRDDVVLKMENCSAVEIPAAKLAAGRWHIELDWEGADGKKYFWETTFLATKNG